MESIPNNNRRAPRQKRADQFLRRRQIEETLVALSNIPQFSPVGTLITARTPHVEYTQSLKKRYPEMFGTCTELDIHYVCQLLREAWKAPDPRNKEWLVFLLRDFYARILRLREKYSEDDGRQRVIEWRAIRETQDDWLKVEKLDGVNLAQRLYHSDDSDLAKSAREATTPPPLTKFEEALFHLQRNLHRALYCKNPECPAPYFFRNSTGQEYCSPDCAAWGKRNSNKISARKSRKKGRKT
jgi:hypothetical protein